MAVRRQGNQSKRECTAAMCDWMNKYLIERESCPLARRERPMHIKGEGGPRSILNTSVIAR